MNSPSASVEELAIVLRQAKDGLLDAYNLLRRPAKEVLLTVVSDLERTKHHKTDIPHAIPIMYNLSGYSLKMSSVRGLLKDAIAACEENSLNVKVVAFDGQFLEISTQGEDGRPLTLCKLAKHIWDEARSTAKTTQLQHLFNKNNVGDVRDANDIEKHFSIQHGDPGVVYITSKRGYSYTFTPQSINQCFMNTPIQDTWSDETVKHVETDYIMQYLPDDVLNNLDTNSLELIKQANTAISQSTNTHEGQDSDHQDLTCDDMDVMEEQQLPEPSRKLSSPITTGISSTVSPQPDLDYESALCALIASCTTPSKWDYVTLTTFKNMLSSAENINKNFTVAELKSILSAHGGIAPKGRKCVIVDAVSAIYGDRSVLPQSPPKLKHLLRTIIGKTWPKAACNILYASSICADRYIEWNSSNPFPVGCAIVTDTGFKFDIPFWYAQPSSFHGKLIQFIIDPHHLLVNNRGRCCSHGMREMGIVAEAWHKVARESSHNKSELSVEIAIELRDRQTNGFAQLTFSEEVQQVMLQNNDTTAAHWCELIRHFYAAVDESAVPVHTRIQWLLDMRKHLLRQFHFGVFPPPGNYVKGLPMTQFEGLLCNVDRRIQMYNLVHTTTGQSVVWIQRLCSQDSRTSIQKEVAYCALMISRRLWVQLHAYWSINWTKTVTLRWKRPGNESIQNTELTKCPLQMTFVKNLQTHSVKTQFVLFRTILIIQIDKQAIPRGKRKWFHRRMNQAEVQQVCDHVIR